MGSIGQTGEVAGEVSSGGTGSGGPVDPGGNRAAHVWTIVGLVAEVQGGVVFRVGVGTKNVEATRNTPLVGYRIASA